MKKQKKIILIALAVLIAVGTITAVSLQKPNLPSEDSSVSGDTDEHDEECEDECCSEDEETPEPSTEPTLEPSTSPTIEPTTSPTVEPSDELTSEPTIKPTEKPVITTTPKPTTAPTQTPTLTEKPSVSTPDDTDVKLPQSAEEEARMIFESRVAKGCSVCGSKTCSTFNYDDLTVDSSRCEQYSDATNPALYCQICGKVNGNGTSGTCCTPMWDTVCYYCGEDIIAGQCHTCK